MNKIDLIIDALNGCKGATQLDNVCIAEALAAARELRDLKPVAWADRLDLAKDGNWDTFICKHSSENHKGTRFKIPLYTAPPKPEQWTPVEIGVDVTPDGAHVVGMYVLMPETVRHVFYSKFHPAPKREQDTNEVCKKLCAQARRSERGACHQIVWDYGFSRIDNEEVQAACIDLAQAIRGRGKHE